MLHLSAYAFMHSNRVGAAAGPVAEPHVKLWHLRQLSHLLSALTCRTCWPSAATACRPGASSSCSPASSCSPLTCGGASSTAPHLALTARCSTCASCRLRRGGRPPTPTGRYATAAAHASAVRRWELHCACQPAVSNMDCMGSCGCRWSCERARAQVAPVQSGRARSCSRRWVYGDSSCLKMVA